MATVKLKGMRKRVGGKHYIRVKEIVGGLGNACYGCAGSDDEGGDDLDERAATCDKLSMCNKGHHPNEEHGYIWIRNTAAGRTQYIINIMEAT